MGSSTSTSNVFYSGSNPFINTLYYGGAWQSTASVVPVHYYFQSGVDPYDFSGISFAQDWNTAERAALNSVMAAWESVANIDLIETADNNEADIWYWKGTDAEVGALGWHEVPTSSAIEPLYGVFSYQGQGWNTAGLQPGGYAYLTILHEIGHGLGLAHPHEGGLNSGPFAGVTSAFGDYGDDFQNQGIFTVMTYNDGWQQHYGSHSDNTYGWNSGPMALDIAAVQSIYGANNSYRTGDDTYALPDANGAGTFWSAIWDAGGTDELTAAGSSRDFNIDLREAPLTGNNAGGCISFSEGIIGGFTIANGAVIENATGGSGDDTLMGNDADNLLRGGGGTDNLTGGSGDDTLDGGGGGDVIDGGNGRDTASYESATRSVRVDLANDAFMYNDAVGDTFVDIEVFRAGAFADQLRGDAGENEFYTGGVSDRLYGRGGDDMLFGEAGADAFYGGTGVDTMTGGDDSGRRDRYIYFNIVESGVGTGNRDIITDYVAGEDRIEISRFDADITRGFNQAFTFVGDTGFSNTASELRYGHIGGNTILQADVDGDGAADFEIELLGTITLTAGDFLL